MSEKPATVYITIFANEMPNFEVKVEDHKRGFTCLSVGGLTFHSISDKQLEHLNLVINDYLAKKRANQKELER